jgi:ABC-type transporter Mla MlaB component
MTDADDTLRLEGALTLSEVPELERRHRDRFAGTPPSVVSLADVESGDSSVLALLLEWQSLARRSGRRIRFENPPQNLGVIARLTGVAPLLGWTENDDNANYAKEDT